MLLWMAVSVTVLAAGDTSEVRLVREGYFAHDDCLAWKDNMEAQGSDLMDTASGQILLGRYFTCAPVEAEEELAGIRQAMKQAR